MNFVKRIFHVYHRWIDILKIIYKSELILHICKYCDNHINGDIKSHKKRCLKECFIKFKLENAVLSRELEILREINNQLISQKSKSTIKSPITYNIPRNSNDEIGFKHQEKYILSIIDELKKDIESFYSHNVMYIGYIGEYNNEHHFKFGYSSNILNRENSHQKQFETFNFISLESCYNSNDIEAKFKRYLKRDKLLVSLTIQNKRQN